MAEGYKYWAFISYSHQDRAWGDWLHKTLETYRVPSRLVGRESRDGQVPKRLFPIFRDRDELPSSANLGDVLNESLRQSRYQIVICSPRAASSRWVNEEIKYFKSLGREDRVLCLIVDGEPHVADVPGREQEECFAPALRYRVDRSGALTEQPAEPIAADAREHADGKRGAKLKLLSGLLGVGYDELVQRERQRQLWQRVQAGFASAAMIALCVGAWQWYLHQRESREREITIEKLVENGRQELLAGQQARAAVYLNEAYKMGDDSVPLRFMLAQAMKPVEALTNVRVEHGGVAVYKSAFSPDGKRFVLHVLVVGAGQQKAVGKVYDAASGDLIAVLEDAPALPASIEFSADGSRLLMAGYPDDNRVGAPITRIWDFAHPDRPLRLNGISGYGGRSLHPDGKRVLVSGESGVDEMDVDDGRRVARYAEGAAVSAATYSPDGEFIVIADESGPVQVLSVRSGRVVRQLEGGDSQRVLFLAYAPDGKRLVAISDSGDLRTWDDTGRLSVAFAADPQYINEIKFDRAGRRYLTIGNEGYKIWSAARGVLLFSLNRALSQYSSGALSPDGSVLITADFLARTAEAWDVRAKRKLYSLDFHSDGISSAAFDATGERLLISGRDGYAEIWRMPVVPEWKYESFETLPRGVRFSQDGSRLLIGGGDYSGGTAMTMDTSSHEVLAQYLGHQGFVVSAEYSPDEGKIVTASADGTARIWDVEDGRVIATLAHDPAGLNAAIFNAKGDRLLTSTDYWALKRTDSAALWNALNWELVARLRHDGNIIAASFDVEGERVATGGEDTSIKIWSSADGQLLQTISGHGSRVRSLQFSRDGHRLLSAADDNSIRIWDSLNGQQLTQLSEPGMGLLTGAIFSPDERSVAIATQTGGVWIWSVESGHVVTLSGHQQQVAGLKFNSDASLLFSHSYDGTARVWDVRRGRELEVVAAHSREVIGLDLSPDETSLVTSAWGQLAQLDIAPETRSPEHVEKILRCGTQWALNQVSLKLDSVARPPDNCFMLH